MYGVADKTVIPESYSSRGTLPSDNPNPIKIMGDLSQVSKPARKRKKRRFRLGDSIESALSAVGVTQERVEEWVGGPCGCSGRKKKANALSDWAQDVLFGKITEEEGAEALEDLMNRKRAEAKTKTKSR